MTEDVTTAEPESRPSYGYTYGRESGNRIVEGEADLPRTTPVDIPLSGIPTWVVGTSLGDGVAWTVALTDGRTQTFALDGSGEVREIEVADSRLAPGEPPLIRSEGGSVEVVVSLNGAESDLTHPLPDSETPGEVIGIQTDGELFTETGSFDGTSIGSLDVTAPPAARIVRSPGGGIAVLSDPTNRYAHDVLGDAIEADSMTVVESASGETQKVLPASGGVFEGIAPLWFEDGTGRELLAVTESASGLGSRISVYDPSGGLVAAGPFIEEDFKWRHVLAAGPFESGGIELAVVRTPHVDPVVEFYRISGDALETAAEVPGYTSHRIYTRNLDTATSGDLDGDGRLELLVPDPTYTRLAAIRRDGAGASAVWELPVGGEVSTNIGTATDAQGAASLAVGRSDGTLRVWR